MRYKTKKKVSYILIVLFLIIAIGLIFFFVQNANAMSDGIIVKVGGRELENGEELILNFNEEMEFVVEDKLGSKLEGYAVSITPNVTSDNDFDVIASRESYRYSEIKDLCKGFDLNIESGKFILKNTLDPDGILSKVLEQEAITSRDVDFYNVPYLKLNIIFDKSTVSYPLRLGSYPKRIEFDKEVILF